MIFVMYDYCCIAVLLFFLTHIICRPRRTYSIDKAYSLWMFWHSMVFMSVGLPVSMLVMWASPAKTAELIEILIGRKTQVGPQNHPCIIYGSHPPRKGAVLGSWRDFSTCYQQRSNWAAAEAVGCHIKFSPMKNPSVMQPVDFRNLVWFQSSE